MAHRAEQRPGDRAAPVAADHQQPGALRTVEQRVRRPFGHGFPVDSQVRVPGGGGVQLLLGDRLGGLVHVGQPHLARRCGGVGLQRPVGPRVHRPHRRPVVLGEVQGEVHGPLAVVRTVHPDHDGRVGRRGLPPHDHERLTHPACQLRRRGTEHHPCQSPPPGGARHDHHRVELVGELHHGDLRRTVRSREEHRQPGQRLAALARRPVEVLLGVLPQQSLVVLAVFVDRVQRRQVPLERLRRDERHTADRRLGRRPPQRRVRPLRPVEAHQYPAASLGQCVCPCHAAS